MDLNLLDTCIYHFVEGTAPDLTGTNTCSVARNLNRLLDQDGSNAFNILDVDLCIKAFIKQQPCANGTCPDNQVFCSSNDDCGKGLYCDPDLNKCTRDCGRISDRARTKASQQPGEDELERACMGRMKTCDYDSGMCTSAIIRKGACTKHADCTSGARCVNSMCEIAPACQIDNDCPVGAYCLVGRCEPRCYRNIDCPDSNWSCSASNLCTPKPATASAGQPFDPRAYSVQFANKTIQLDPVNDRYELPLVIMSLQDQRQVFDSPTVVFGYRLEVTYNRKDSPQCSGSFLAMTLEQQRECIISPEKEFITIENPFGTVYATGNPKLKISLNKGALELLGEGSYQATLTAIFNNGSSSPVTIRLNKPSVSGEYGGRLSVYLDGPENLLGSGTVGMQIQVDEAVTKTWEKLLDENNIAGDREFRNLTSGAYVTGALNGNESMLFDLPSALSTSQNKIPVVGIYSKDLRMMRLIGVVDIPAGAASCRGQNGLCTTQALELQVQNPFGRKVRRIFEFIGPYDDVLHEFRGQFRDTYTGLTPGPVTFEGGFILKQTKSQEPESDIRIPALLNALNSGAVAFPALDTVLSEVDSNVTTHCGSYASARQHFADRTAFQSYLTNTAGNARVLSNLVRLKSVISDALGTMVNPNTVNLHDYLKGKVRFCTGPQDNDNCINEAALRCGLELHRKAILAGATASDAKAERWIYLSDFDQNRSQNALFCGDSSEPCTDPRLEPTLFTLQEHNRFYKDLFDVTSYQAGDDLSDAFFALYKAAHGSAMDDAIAYEHKNKNLTSAIKNYDKALAHVFNDQGTSVLFAWPIGSFSGNGDLWIKQIQTVLRDRMDGLVELIDLRRRVMADPGQNDFLYAHHVMFYEVLKQAYVMALQRKWQKSEFAFDQQWSQRIFDRGAMLLAKTNESRNPLGLQANRVFFENGDPTLANWQAYRKRLTGTSDGTMNGGGDLGAMEATIANALTLLKSATANQNALTSALSDPVNQLNAELDRICGPARALPTECNVEDEEKKLYTECLGPDCVFKFQCDGPECQQVIQAFVEATNPEDSSACRADTTTHSITVGTEDRLCVRGQMGQLLQERVSLRLSREQVVRKVQALIRQIGKQKQLIATVQTKNTELNSYVDEQDKIINDVAEKLAMANKGYEIAKATAEGLNCLTIAGTAAGTTCPQTMALASTVVEELRKKFDILPELDRAQNTAEQGKQKALSQTAAEAQLVDLRNELDNHFTDVENLIAEYETATQQIFNLNIQIADLQYQAQQIATRYGEQVDNVFARLVGEDSAEPLLRNVLVKQADAQFQDLLLNAYKMVQAFIHRHNIGKQNLTQLNCFTKGCLIEKVFRAVTVADIKDVVRTINQLERDYCGATPGLDCDYLNNSEVLRFSVRDQLFPDLQDRVDAKGGVLTAGQQFHNIITGSDFVKRVADPLRGLSSRIEIPFAIWANDRGLAGRHPQQFLNGLDADCNHIIVGAPPANGTPGTIAAIVVGENLGAYGAIPVELWRGDTDYIRSCDQTDPQTNRPEILTYTVGQPVLTQTTALFGTKTGAYNACTMTTEQEELESRSPASWNMSSCFKYFARDRSVAAPDWRFIIPNVGIEKNEPQSWILGDRSKVRPSAVPVITDIVLYVRFNDRPMSSL